MQREHIVIVGNGPCGHSAALTARTLHDQARITLIGGEHERSYLPHLLPGFMEGRLKRDDLFAATHEMYADYRIKLRIGQQVVRIDPNERVVILDHKESIRCDGLILATGGSSRIPEPMLRFSQSLSTLKTLKDADEWRTALANVESVLMLGGDLTAFAVTNALLGMGKQVHFVLYHEAFWPLRFDMDRMQDAYHALTEKGVDVLLLPRTLELGRSAAGVFFADIDSRRIEVGRIGAFFGLYPDVSFLSGSGLTIDRGILVDEYLKTGFDGVYAAGDCAQIYHPAIQDYWVSIGYQNAINLGAAAAHNLLGGHISAEASPENVVELDGVRVNTSWWLDY